MAYEIITAKVQKYRSIVELTIPFEVGKMTALCGQNNVGKTNFLRALHLFFSLDPDNFVQERDIPYHIFEGSRGGGNSTVITVTFKDKDTFEEIPIKAEFRNVKGTNEVELTSRLETLSKECLEKIVKSFRFFFIESSNIDLPQVIADIFEHDVLLGLDKLRSRQTNPLKTLKTFFTEAQVAVKDIEDSITLHLKGFVDTVPGFDTNKWQAKISFPEFDKLRDAISNMVEFTLMDSNDRSLETKGSGIQRVVMLSVMKHVQSQSKGQSCIWAIDEPEAFLQAGLQKTVFRELRSIASGTQVVVSTHSPHFVDFDNLKNTHLLEKSPQEERIYARKQSRVFIYAPTMISPKMGLEKVKGIRDHFGLDRNDSWYVLPFNLLVEGASDQNYLKALGNRFGFYMPNMFVAGGVDKFLPYLEFLDGFCKEQSPKPKVAAIFDSDSAGRSAFDKAKAKVEKHSYRGLNLSLVSVKRFDGLSQHDPELEDWIYPELLFMGVNSLLKARKRYRLKSTQQKQRSSPSNFRTPILQFLTEQVAQRNPDENRMDFKDLAWKMELCRHVCEVLKTVTDEQMADWHSTHPETRKWLEGVLALEQT